MADFKVLIVEDDLIISMFTKIILEKKEYQVVDTLTTGESAVEYVKKEKPDLILMDIWLAGKLDGIEATEIILKFAKIPVIYITANTDTQTVERTRATGAVGLLSKPFVPADLYNSIENIISQSK